MINTHVSKRTWTAPIGSAISAGQSCSDAVRSAYIAGLDLTRLHPDRRITMDLDEIKEAMEDLDELGKHLHDSERVRIILRAHSKMKLMYGELKKQQVDVLDREFRSISPPKGS
jgi:hypothetical protein